jgi:phage terminase large subunit-like protein
VSRRGARAGLRLDRTLGPLVITWIERELCHGPGDVQGQRIEHDDEEVAFILRCYEIDDRGRRRIDRAVLSRPKGRRKSEIAAELACAEALGPVRFAGWDHDGRPLGAPVRSPFIPCVATEEGQAGNTYGAIEFMLREGAVSRTPGLDVGLTRTYVPGGGKIAAVSARAGSKDGGKETFAVFDETHLYVSPELRRLHETIRRNLTKRKQAEPWALETSTMYAPGEDSVAEHSHRYAEAVLAGHVRDPRLLFDHRQASLDFDFGDDDQLRAALADAYGAASEWMDLERLISEARDPQTDPGDFRRYFLNQPTERTQGKWITDERWRNCRSNLEIPDGSTVVVGVDAARTRDCTACVWSWHDPDGGRIVQRARVWSCIPSKPHHELSPGGRLDNDLVRDFIRDELMGRYAVRLLFFDERYFDTQANDLSADGLVVVEMHQGKEEMGAAWDLYHELVYAGPEPRVAHDGDVVFAQHVRNAVGAHTRRGWVVKKANDARPIDALAAAVMSAYAAEHLDDFLSYEPWAASWG